MCIYYLDKSHLQCSIKQIGNLSRNEMSTKSTSLKTDNYRLVFLREFRTDCRSHLNSILLSELQSYTPGSMILLIFFYYF